MNKLLPLSVLLGCCILFSCSPKKKKRPLGDFRVETDTLQTDTIRRSTITFILGDDAERQNNPYYTLANHYYRLSPVDKTERVIDTINSLLEVRNYLETYPPENGLPWGLINLVSHGNEFIDLSVKVEPGGLRTSAESVREALNKGKFKALDSTLVDSLTLFYLHGCAVGNNQALLNALSVVFGGKQNPSPVIASRLFEYYGYTSQHRNPQSIQHYFAKVWYAFFKPDSHPEDEDLIKQFKQRYPKEKTPWEEGINRQIQSNPSQIYHITLGIPVIWDDVYTHPEERPVLYTEEDQKEWLGRQKGFHKMVKKTKIPLEYFDIKYFNSKIKGSNNELYYTIRAKAKASVICVIQPLLAEEEEARNQREPYVPDQNDSVYFGFARSAKR